MIRAAKASRVRLADNFEGSILDFLCERFPHTPCGVWEERLESGKLQWTDGEALTPQSRYQPGKTLEYFREVAKEPVIPFEATVEFENEFIVVVNKPAYLPVNVGGRFIEQTLTYRMRERLGLPELTAAHRLDRLTSGLVLMVKHQAHRDAYQRLFRELRVQKRYEAIARINDKRPKLGQQWEVSSRIVKSDPSFTFKSISKQPHNARSLIECIDVTDQEALFSLYPISGKTHQLRLHMMDIGFPIKFDNFYPKVLPLAEEVMDKPLHLRAVSLGFECPLSKRRVDVCCSGLALDGLTV